MFKSDKFKQCAVVYSPFKIDVAWLSHLVSLRWFAIWAKAFVYVAVMYFALVKINSPWNICKVVCFKHFGFSYWKNCSTWGYERARRRKAEHRILSQNGTLQHPCSWVLYSGSHLDSQSKPWLKICMIRSYWNFETCNCRYLMTTFYFLPLWVTFSFNVAICLEKDVQEILLIWRFQCLHSPFYSFALILIVCPRQFYIYFPIVHQLTFSICLGRDVRKYFPILFIYYPLIYSYWPWLPPSQTCL